MQAHLEQEGVTISESERRNKERDLANLNRDFQRTQREFREDLNLRRNEELAAVQERASKAIMEIAENEKFDLILEEAVYVSPSHRHHRQGAEGSGRQISPRPSAAFSQEQSVSTANDRLIPWAEIVARFGGELVGDAAVRVSQVASLETAQALPYQLLYR